MVHHLQVSCKWRNQVKFKHVFISAPLPAISPPSFCEATGDVMVAGKYTKSFCVDSNIATYADAKANCEANGMRLFELNSVEATAAIVNHAMVALNEFDALELFVNGQSDPECSVISNEGGTFKKQVEDCTSVLQSVCEFIKIPG